MSPSRGELLSGSGENDASVPGGEYSVIFASFILFFYLRLYFVALISRLKGYKAVSELE